MKKKLVKAGFLLLLVTSFFLFLPLNALAAESQIQDNADLFTDQEEAELKKEAAEIADKYDINVVIMTDNRTGTTGNYAQDVVDAVVRKKYPEGCLVFVINMADRSFWTDFYGHKNVAVLSQSQLDKIGNASMAELSDGDFADAAKDFLNEGVTQIEIQRGGAIRKLTLYPGTVLLIVGGSCLAAVAIAGLWTFAKSSQHKDKRERSSAEEYGDKFALSRNSDRFVSHYETRVPRPKQSSSSGGSHGNSHSSGSGGHF
ncbi:MAG: TPM domain-containing protein [Ileibacterium sp.]|nr:TPM domain-containing protein [Ileibacterium sp.]